MARRFPGAPCPTALRLMGVRWSVASPLNPRPVAALREARGVELAHATLPRWVLTDSPPLAAAFPHRQRPGWGRGRRDKTYINQWC